jgi:hypothetical protein
MSADNNKKDEVSKSIKKKRAELNRVGIKRIRNATGKYKGRTYSGLRYHDGTRWEGWFPVPLDIDIPPIKSIEHIVDLKETLEVRASELVKEINQRTEEGLESFDLQRPLFLARKVTNCLERFLKDSSDDTALDMFQAGIAYADFQNLPHGEDVRKFHREGNKRPKTDLPHWKKRLWEFLETQEVRPNPTQVVNLCGDFTKAGKRMSEGVQCGDETVLRDTLEKEIKRRWKQIQR